MRDEEINREKMLATLELVMRLITTGQYEQLDELYSGNRLWSEYVRKVVEEYPYKIVAPPHSFLPVLLECEPFQLRLHQSPIRWYVVLSLYTVEEGVSDLSVQLNIIDTPDAIYGAEIMGVLVM